MQKFVLMACAGGLGALARYALAGFVHRFAGATFPWGTATVNIVGCFLAGALFVLFDTRWPVHPETRTVVMVGFMGAFTTFSTYMLETGELLRSSEWIHAAGNLALQNGAGLVALFAGMALGRLI